jgi:hypothetical protein
MKTLSDLRNRLLPRNSPAGSQTAGKRTRATADPPLPFAGYDRLDDRKVIDALSDHSQIELEAAEAYERSHKRRERVLDKLRYMRGSEPLPGYDALSTQEIITAVELADPATIKKVRGYERKFANRPSVLEAVVRAHHQGVAERPAITVPAYQPMSAGPAAARPKTRGAR